MNTAPNSEPPSAVAEPAAAEAAHNDLVARLVGEAFSGLARSPGGDAPSPSVEATPPSLEKPDALPVDAAHDVPAAVPFAARAPQPRVPSGVPPGHPNLQPARPKSPRPEKSQSGPPRPISATATPFGER